MDCHTTGIEPALALVTSKRLVGGGTMTLVNTVATLALAKLGYNSDRLPAITAHIANHGTVEGAPHLNPAHLPVFDCALRAQNATRTIRYMGHIQMMEAVQPFLSGGISKTINMPEEATVDDIMAAYIESWKRGLKAVAIYRDGSKKAQPVVTKKEEEAMTAPTPSTEAINLGAPPKPIRHRLPDDRTAITHKFMVANYEGFITVGLYQSGQPGEVFIRMAKQGSTIAGLMDAFATSISVGLQHGVPLQTFVDKFAHMRFEPSGWTHNEELGYAKSIMDYVFRWLENRFLKPQQESLFPATPAFAQTAVSSAIAETTGAANTAPADLASLVDFGDSPSCPKCGAIMHRAGTCYRCGSCGESSGCS
jgi:ribonucleoside-diphosphate reductase alpha chain